MSYESLLEQLPDLRADLARARGELAQVSARVITLERAIDGIEGLRDPEANPNAQEADPTTVAKETVSDASGLRGAAAILAIVREQPNKVWRVMEIVGAITSRGWIAEGAKNPRAATETALMRLVNKGTLTKVAPGRYRWPGEGVAKIEA